MNKYRFYLTSFIAFSSFYFFSNWTIISRHKVKDFMFDKFESIINKFDSKNKICEQLQNKIERIVYLDRDKWSITVRNKNSNVISDVNGKIMRIPASNQKLYTTAYALDKLGPTFRLSTNLYKNSNGFYEIKGSGDPDISTNELQKISLIIKDNPFYTHSEPKILLYEEEDHLWWPSNWSLYDKKHSYGAPVSRLAFSSNSSIYSLQDPLLHFTEKLAYSLRSINLNYKVETLSTSNYNLFTRRRLLHSIKSAPLYMLLSLANSESHNFTSEVLLKVAANSWDTSIASNRLRHWLSSNGIDRKSNEVNDGSGLSRSNRTTTNSISKLLYIMSKHKHNRYYISSMSLVGARGTLKNQYISSSTKLNFYGKTGTLTGIRSLSGYLLTNKGKVIVSIIHSSTQYNPNNFVNILSAIYNQPNCIK